MPMSEDSIHKNNSVTPSEKYLKTLCDKAFLSLWSYPSVFRDQKESRNPEGKELCDLLVVFGKQIIIFSDKQCAFPRTGNLELDWSRWFNRAVTKSAEQAWGAERWIRKHPDRIFLDRKCAHHFPIKLSEESEMKIHIVVVSHEASARCTEELGGSGSLMLKSDMNDDKKIEPFVIPDLNPEKTFVHVLDDTTLDILLKTNNTISDFIAYLIKKENFFRSGKKIFASGEEELLAHYLKNINSQKEHDFVFDEKYNGISLIEGEWENFKNSQQRKAQIEADRVSYFWDEFIERFNQNALNGTQFYASHSGIEAAEKIMRFLAREPRLRRRLLADGFLEHIHKSNPTLSSRRYILPSNPGDPYYVLLLLPHPKNLTEEEYRKGRREILEAYCKALKYRIPEAEDIIGIATEPEILNGLSSEDALYMNVRDWSEDLQEDTKKIMKILNIPEELLLVTRNSEDEYPEPKQIFQSNQLKNPRNKPCSCGSGLKWKRCHGKFF